MSTKKVLLLGVGAQGKAALYDLVHQPAIGSIVAVDTSPSLGQTVQLYPQERVRGRPIDVRDLDAVSSLIEGVDLVVDALPSVLSPPLVEMAAERGVSLVNSMYLINPSEQESREIRRLQDRVRSIDATAKRTGAIILSEFGLDPGIDIAIGAQALAEFDEPVVFNSYGAGLPLDQASDNPLRYKFSWSPLGVMRAYRRPARRISGGREVSIRADEIFVPRNIHQIELPELGPLECHLNGDAVHYAELFGIRAVVREMGRYTCRYPGNAAFWNTLIKCGFLDEDRIKVGQADVVPLAFTTALLEAQDQFHYQQDERDVAMVRADVRGLVGGRRRRVVYQLVDTRDLVTGFTAMQRTVGFTLGLGAQLILERQLTGNGVLGPIDVPFELFRQALDRRGIRITRQAFEDES